MNSLDLRCGLSMAVGDAVANLKSKARMISTSEEIAQVDRNIDGGEFDKECIAGEYAELQFEKEKSEMNSVSSDPKIEEEILEAEEKLQFPDNEPGGVHYVKGNKAIKENDFGEAADNFSRAHEIRVAHYGELAPECVHTYYKYGCALLYKAQEEADPLADVSKKEDGSQHGSNKDGSILAPLRYAIVYGCSDATIVLGVPTDTLYGFACDAWYAAISISALNLLNSLCSLYMA
ncbi:hypothetical protein JHK87_055867 [Glycine soja]|nr:hypothetical protein JHK87_055867 [Glycine soja]